MFTLLFTDLGTSDVVAFCLDAGVVLIALQLLLRGTTYIPLAVLKRYREVSWLVAIGTTVLLLLINAGILAFANAFMPRIYSALALFEFTSTSAWEMGVLIVGVAVLAPFYEELVFRGVALRDYRDARSSLFAVLFTSALFGLVHGSIIHILYVFPMGVVFALVMLKTGQLWTVIVAHGLNNLVVTLLPKLDVPGPPATLGVLGLVVAAAAFWAAVRWLGLPESPAKENEGKEKKSIWTISLVIVLILTAIAIIETTYTALGLGVEAAL